jgi:hypothetical protein
MKRSERAMSWMKVVYGMGWLACCTSRAEDDDDDNDDESGGAGAAAAPALASKTLSRGAPGPSTSPKPKSDPLRGQMRLCAAMKLPSRRRSELRRRTPTASRSFSAPVIVEAALARA